MKTHLLAVALCLSLAGLTAAQETKDSLNQKAAAVLAQLDGTLDVPGLREPVEVLRDQWGVAHIYAKNDADLFFAQGFVVAQDRLFQIDVWRRVGNGETAALVGEKGLAGDRFARLVKYRGDMDAEWRSYAPDARQIAEAFTRGINAAIDQMGDRLPIEFQILNYKPARWKPEDILGRMSGLVMCGNFLSEASRAQLIDAVGVKAAQLLVPTDPVVAYAPLPGLDLKGIDRQTIFAGYDAAISGLPFEPNKGGSNNWVVDGTRTASGKPLLAGDPHRAILLPSLRYIVHLNAPGWNVIGAGEPALPGVALGHNDHVAWALTIVNTDQADLYVEQLNPADPTEYRDGDAWKKLDVVREQVVVRGRDAPVEIELQFSKHGPILHVDRDRNRAFALRWVGFEPGAAAYLASLRLDRVKNAKEFVQELAHWKIPALNMTHADVDGNIGWVAAGATPIRDGWDGLLPVPGHTGKYEWRGFLPVRDLPQSHNPPEHYIMSANYKKLPPDYPHHISLEWSQPFRHLQLDRRLTAHQGPFTLDDFGSMQHDSTTIPGQELVRLLDVIDVQTLDAECVALLKAWDGVLSTDSRAAVLYGFWLDELLGKFYSSFLPKGAAEFARGRGGPAVMLAELREPKFLNNSDSPTTRDELLKTTFAAAVARAKQRFPKFPNEGSWGELHTASFAHPLAKLGPAYAAAFNRGPVPKAGDALTPNAATHDKEFRMTNGASYRELFDLSDWDKGLATSTPGQSGQPGSPHYDDLLPLWAKEQYFPLMYSRPKVESVTKNRLALQPRNAPPPKSASAKTESRKTKPTEANVPYGKHPKQVVDFYQAESTEPTPVLLNIHGGGWGGGSKESIAPDAYLRAGVSIVSVEYRLLNEATADGVVPPVQGPLGDAARALQFVRSKAKEWNLDKTRIIATGSSAGACTCLWLAFHDDLADPKSDDPVARESTRLTTAIVGGAQTSLDPKQMKEWTPNSFYGGHAFGFKPDPQTKRSQFEVFLAEREKILPWIKEYSPYELVTSDDPPVALFYGAPPAMGQEAKDPTHAANFGLALQEKCKSVGVECRLMYPGSPDDEYAVLHQFLLAKLKALK